MSHDEPAPEDAGTEVLIFADEFGLLIQGPENAAEAAIGYLLGRSNPGPGGRQRLSGADAAALGATGVALAATSGEYLRLTAGAADLVKRLGAEFDGTGALRGWVRDGHEFAGQLTFQPVSLAAEQALALQTAAVSLALRSAIADVQRAVEEVADKVDHIGKHLRARLQGDVIGAYHHLSEVAEQTNRRGHLLEADWDSVAGVRNQLHRDLDTLHAYVRSEVGDLTLALNVPDRRKKIRRFVADPGSVADVLRLILVTEQSLHLYEYLRLQRVRDRDPEHVDSALADARASLVAQQGRDEELVQAMVAAIDRSRVVEPLGVHHVLTKGALDREAVAFHNEVAAFALSSRSRQPGELGTMPRAGLKETGAELRHRAAATTHTVRALTASVAQEGAARAGSAGRQARQALTRKRPPQT